LWLSLPAAGAVGFWWWRAAVRTNYRLPPSVTSADQVSIAEFSNVGTLTEVTKVPKVVRTEAEWGNSLTPQQFHVTRSGATDDPYTGTYYLSHSEGLFRCVCCDTALFDSKSKYDSGTGWPSFWQPIADENVRTVPIAGLAESAALNSGIEVLCARCDAHLGHIFGDGPEPTGLRYCINESSLRFVPRSV